MSIGQPGPEDLDQQYGSGKAEERASIQERALRYLERKRQRDELASQQSQSETNGDLLASPVISSAQTPTTPPTLPVSSTQPATSANLPTSSTSSAQTPGTLLAAAMTTTPPTVPLAPMRASNPPQGGRQITPLEDLQPRRVTAFEGEVTTQMRRAPSRGATLRDGASAMEQARKEGASAIGKGRRYGTPIGVVPLHGGTVEGTRSAERMRQRQKLLLHHLARKHMRQGRLKERRHVSRFWLTLGCTILTLFLLFFSITGTGAYMTYRIYRDTQNRYGAQVGGLRALLPLDNLKMYDSKGVPIGQLIDQGLHTTVKLTDVTQQAQDATVSTEDKNFWTNPGVDLARTVQAALDDVRSGHVVEGGSTITQQLIKKLVVGDQVSIERKLQEIMLTPMLNSQYSKSDILEMYLNTVYYGEQAYGIDAATNVYFGLQDKANQPAAKQLDLAQAAMLAGIINSPDGNDPFQHPQAAFARLNFVLDRMVADGRVQRVDALDALKEAQSPNFFKAPGPPVNRAPHFFNFVLLQLQHSFHLTRQQLSRSDIQVYTTLDLGLQDKIQQIARDHIAQLRDINHATNAAEVLIDFHTGAIRSLLGSIDYNDKSIDGQFDVATQGYRQPGSSFKPYVYVAAFEQGISPAQAIDDQPLTIDLPGANPPTFSPTNYDLKYHGHMTLRCALQNSLNIPAVKVLQHVGINNAVDMAHAMGITDTKGFAGYSLVLGGLSIHLIDHTSAYGTFANGGVHVPYYSIDKVIFASSGQTYGHPADPGTQVISPQLAYMMTSVLSDNPSRIPEFSDCNPLQLYSNSQYDCYAGDRGIVRPAAAKTGTTTDFRDNWTVGYTTDYVMGVWAGNNDNSPMINVTGVQGAAPIWHDAMLVAEQNHPIHDFVNPGGLERATVTYPDGVQTTDWFLPGTQPTYSLPTTPFPGSPDTNGDQTVIQDQAAAHPYCPSSYTFAAPPPSDHEPAGNNGWW